MEKRDMITVEKGIPYRYSEFFAGFTTLYTDRCAERVAENGAAFFAYLDGVPAGYMFIEKKRGVSGIIHVFTKPELRGRGVMQSLVRAAVSECETGTVTSLSDSHEHFQTAAHVFEKCGFDRRDGRYIYRCDSEDMWARWDAYMQKSGKRLCDTLRRQGYQTVTLADAPEELLQQFRETPHSEYKCEQNHQHLILPGAEVTPEVSVMLTLKGRLAAYVFSYMPDRISAIFQTLSSSAALHGSGVILLAITEGLAKVRERGVTRLVFSMEEAGASANAFREKVLSVLVSKRSRIVSFTYFPKEETLR